MSLVIKNGTIYQNGELFESDVLIEKNKIIAVGKNLSAPKTIDASGMLVVPGLVDVHVHYRDPGQTYKEDIESGTKAAARGGFTTVGAMPNVIPVPNTAELMAKMVKKNQERGLVHIFQYGPVTVDETSDVIPDYKKLKAAGAFALSNDGHGVQSAGVMYEAMQKAKQNNLIIAAHAQDNSLFKNGVINEGKKAKELNLPEITELAETTQIARDLLLAQKTGVHYHICHVSTKTSLDLVRRAKEQGINVSCEVAPHHLLLSDSDIKEDDPYFKMNPPLRSKEDQAALIEGLLDGTIDMIATDHAPHAKNEKSGSFKDAAFGITGSETAFSSLYTNLVKTNKLPLTKLLSLMTENPAKIFALKEAGRIEPGKEADLAIFDLEHKSKIQADNYQSKGVNTPFTGHEFYGETVKTIVSGKIIYER